MNYCFIYSLHDNEFTEVVNGYNKKKSSIRIFGLNENNESVFIDVREFKPYLYLELPNDIEWDQENISLLIRKLRSKSGCNLWQIDEYSLEQKQKLYFSNRNLFPFLKIQFSCSGNLRSFTYNFKKLEYSVYFNNFGNIKLNIHESEADSCLQLLCDRNIKPSSWIEFKGKKLLEEDKFSHCKNEYIIDYTKIFPLKKNIQVPRPLIMSVDIETYSENSERMPDAFNPEDKIFQISAVFARNGNSESDYENYILSLRKKRLDNGNIIEIDELDQEIVTNTDILLFDNEGDLLCGLSELIVQKDPQILIGYNIFLFDLPYMFNRSVYTKTTGSFLEMNCMKGKVKESEKKLKDVEWSSSAYGKQKFKYIEAQGRIWCDLYPVIMRDYKLNDYKLNTVSEFFLGSDFQKDDLNHKEIFKCYRLFTKDLLSKCAKYCVKDSILVLLLFEKLQIWISLVEMSKVCNTQIFSLYTKGQQIKMYSQVYKKCLDDNILINSSASEYFKNIIGDDEKYTGAYVFTPNPGVYDMVTSFDFSSLYPSAIIAYNLDFTTMIIDENIPYDEKTQYLFEWEDTFKNKDKIMITKKRKFRFLKEPKGIIPTLLEYLLNTRKATKNEMKGIEKQLENCKDLKEIENLERNLVVLDKRQLAFKICANSIYGAMGVKKGFLPFLPGAMSTTYIGRISIEKASWWLTQNYSDIKIIYGDSVVKETPIYVKINDVFNICTIENLSEKYGKREWKMCIDEGKQEKEFYEFDNVMIETWTDKGWTKLHRIIRHKLASHKKIIRILTHTGMVDVTDDHSLLLENGESVSSKETEIGMKLLHNNLDFCGNNSEISENEAKIMGFFMGDGSCGYYNCPSGKKASWALNNSNDEILQKYLNLCKLVYPQFDWIIMDTIESSGVYKITPRKSKTRIIDWIINYRKEMYFENAKIIPLKILNSSKNIRYAFFEGLYDADGDKNGCIRIDQKNQISASQICWLAHSLGFKTSINTRKDKQNIYRITMTKKLQRKDTNSIKKMYEIPYEGYVYDLTTDNHHFAAGIGNLIVHNTDSIYFNSSEFQTKEDANGLDKFCRNLESEMSSQFKSPMKMVYEEAIYWRYLILTKKRYMALKCDTLGNINKKMAIRGVLLSRRDNSQFIRDFYSKIVMGTFYKKPIEEILNTCYENIYNLFTNSISSKELSITKKVGDTQDYKIRLLPEDDKKCIKRLKDLELYDDTVNLGVLRFILSERVKNNTIDNYRISHPIELFIVEEYVKKAYPSQVQLAEKMRQRGSLVSIGERLRFVILSGPKGIKSKVSEKIESLEYFDERKEHLQIDPLYYTKLCIKPFDEVIKISSKLFNKTQYENFFLKLYKSREKYSLVLKELIYKTLPKIIFSN